MAGGALVPTSLTLTTSTLTLPGPPLLPSLLWTLLPLLLTCLGFGCGWAARSRLSPSRPTLGEGQGVHLEAQTARRKAQAEAGEKVSPLREGYHSPVRKK